MVFKLFIIEDDEKHAILQALLEAKFSSCLKKREIRASNYIARVVTDLFNDSVSNLGVSSDISKYKNYLDIVINDLKNMEKKEWKSLGDNQEKYVRNLCSPFSIDDHLLAKLMNIPKKRGCKKNA